MSTKNTFYITTAIDYVNAEPHIGHAYQKIIADILARWHKILGQEVFFLTGTDEHGQKVDRAAKKSGIKPQQFVDKMSKKFKDAWKDLNLKYDRFIRTTDKDHEQVVKEVTERIYKKGDIYKGTYEGLYCVGCEAFFTETEAQAINYICPIHNKKLEKVKEETYFFKLSKYKNKLLEHYKKNKKFILPESRKQEIINRILELHDLSITRTTFKWGIPFPYDKKHIIYVWYEALINYLSGVWSPKLKKFWPADAHLLGTDNGWFHSVIWPAMLLSAGIELPKTVFIHGFLTFNGQKISKSLGNVISPNTLVKKYGTDPIRYFLARQIPFGEEGDFSEKALIERHNNELANKLGNLISRVTTLTEKYGIEKTENKLLKKLKLEKIKKKFENYEIDKALTLIFEFIDFCNEYVQKNKVWETKDKKILYELADSIKTISILLWPFIPETSEKIAKQLNFEIKSLKQIDEPLKIQKIKKSPILFKKI